MAGFSWLQARPDEEVLFWRVAGKGTTHNARMGRTLPLSRDVCCICRTSTSYTVVRVPFFQV